MPIDAVWTEDPRDVPLLGWGDAWGAFGWGTSVQADIYTEEEIT